MNTSTTPRRRLAPPPHPITLPDFTVTATALFLRSQDIAQLSMVCTGTRTVLGSPQLVEWLVGTRSLQGVSTLAQLDLAECLASLNHTIDFGFASVELVPDCREGLARLAGLLKRHHTLEVLVEGHAQPGAPPGLAHQLSRDRAIAVCRALAAEGVEPARLRPRAYSNHRPLARANTSAEAQEKSRRVELYLVQGDDFQFPPERPGAMNLGPEGRVAAAGAQAQVHAQQHQHQHDQPHTFTFDENTRLTRELTDAEDPGGAEDRVFLSLLQAMVQQHDPRHHGPLIFDEEDFDMDFHDDDGEEGGDY